MRTSSVGWQALAAGAAAAICALWSTSFLLGLVIGAVVFGASFMITAR
jgi:hypothetical protein